MIIHRLPCHLANAYLVENQKSGILIDTGAPGSEKIIMRSIQRVGVDLHSIFITHAHIDHYGSAAQIRKHTKAPIIIHRSDEGFLSNGETPLGISRGRGLAIKYLLPLLEVIMKPEPITPNQYAAHRDTLEGSGFNAMVIHTPGHTPGSSSLVFEDGSVFVGDLASSTGKPHLQRYFAHNWEQLLKSAQMLLEYNPKWIYTGHGQQPIPGEYLSDLIEDWSPDG